MSWLKRVQLRLKNDTKTSLTTKTTCIKDHRFVLRIDTILSEKSPVRSDKTHHFWLMSLKTWEPKIDMFFQEKTMAQILAENYLQSSRMTSPNFRDLLNWPHRTWWHVSLPWTCSSSTLQPSSDQLHPAQVWCTQQLVAPLKNKK